jgi:hypothetical protein
MTNYKIIKNSQKRYQENSNLDMQKELLCSLPQKEERYFLLVLYQLDLTGTQARLSWIVEVVAGQHQESLSRAIRIA